MSALGTRPTRSTRYPSASEAEKILPTSGPGTSGDLKVHILRGVDQVDGAEIVRERRYNALAHLTGPFDISAVYAG